MDESSASLSTSTPTNASAALPAAIADAIVKRPHPRVLIVASADVAQLPLIAELTVLGFVVDSATTAEGARRKYRFPGYHDLVIVDGAGCRDGSAVAIAQDLRGVEGEHRAALSAKGPKTNVGRRAAVVQARTTVLCGICDSPEARTQLATAPATPQIAGYLQRRASNVSPAFDIVLRYPLRLHLDSLMVHFCSREGDPAPAVEAPDHRELVREIMRVAGHRFPHALQQRLRSQLPPVEQFSLATAEAATLQARIRTLEGELTAAAAASSEAERETDVANGNARELRDEVNDAVERRIAAEAALDAMRQELEDARRVRDRAATEFDEFRRGVAARARADAELAVKRAAEKIHEAAATGARQSSPAKRRSAKSQSRKRSPRKSMHVPNAVTDSQSLIDSAAAEAAAAADDHAKSSRFLADELDRWRGMHGQMHSKVAALEAECGILKLRFARLKQFLTRSGLPAPSPRAEAGLNPPVRHVSESDVLANTGRRLSVSTFGGDEDDTSRRQALREARMHRHAIRRQSLSVIDRGHVSRDKVKSGRSAMRRRLEAAERNAMSVADAASAANERQRMLARDSVGRDILAERARLRVATVEVEKRASAALQVPVSRLAQRDPAELAAMPEVSRAILTSTEHAAFIDGAFGNFLAHESAEMKQRARLLRDLSAALHSVTDDPRRFTTSGMSDTTKGAVVAAVQQLQSRVDLVLDSWAAAAASRHDESLETLQRQLVATARNIEAFVVPLQCARYFAKHTAPAETQTDSAFTEVDVDALGAAVDAELKDWFHVDSTEYTKAAAVAAGMGAMTASRAPSPMPRSAVLAPPSGQSSAVASPHQPAFHPVHAFDPPKPHLRRSSSSSPLPQAPAIALEQ